MNLEEHAAKTLVLAPAGVPVPRGMLVDTPEGARAAFGSIGPSVVKAQVSTGKRGKAGGVRPARSDDEAENAARAILGIVIGGHAVRRLLMEEMAHISREFYAAVLPDHSARAPVVLFSSEGGM